MITKEGVRKLAYVYKAELFYFAAGYNLQVWGFGFQTQFTGNYTITVKMGPLFVNCKYSPTGGIGMGEVQVAERGG